MEPVDKTINIRFVDYFSERGGIGKDLNVSLLIKYSSSNVGFFLPSASSLGSFTPMGNNENKEPLFVPSAEIFINGKLAEIEPIGLSFPSEEDIALVEGMELNLIDLYDIARAYWYKIFSLDNLVENTLCKDPFYEKLFEGGLSICDDDNWLYDRLFSEIITYFFYNYHIFSTITNLIHLPENCLMDNFPITGACEHDIEDKGIILNINNQKKIMFKELEEKGSHTKELIHFLLA
jgi:hypothetical protein